MLLAFVHSAAPCQTAGNLPNRHADFDQIGHCRCEQRDVVPHRLRALDPTTVRAAPEAHEEKPMLDPHPCQFGIALAEDSPRILCEVYPKLTGMVIQHWLFL